MIWGAEFWASSSVIAANDALFPDGNFYIAYRDNPPDGAPKVEAGLVNALSVSLNHVEFAPDEAGTLGGTCLMQNATGQTVPNPAAPTPCTVVMSAPLSELGIEPGAGLYSISGFSTYVFGAEQSFVPGTRVTLGDTNLADIATTFDDNGTGTTTQ